MRTALYLRISEDRTGEQLGVTRQRREATELCAAKGWTPVEYLDNDISATSGKPRPAYERMLADIRDGTISAVVAWDLDRLHRRPIELEAFMALADEKHLALATVSGDIDLSTPQGRLIARLKGSVAAHEGEHRKARQLVASRQRAEMGIPNWSEAFGYTEGEHGPGCPNRCANRHHRPDPATAPLVKDGYAAILAGSSLNDICRQWNNAGALTATGKPWTPAIMSRFLRQARNAGLRSYKGEIVGPANWPGLVDEAVWRAAQAVMAAPGRGHRKSVRRHLLTGIVLCGKCGHTIGGSYRNDGRIVYICKHCHGISILADNVEPLVIELVGRRLAAPDAVGLLKAEIHDVAEAERLRAEKTALFAQLDAFALERAEGLMTARQVQIASEAVQRKIEVIDHLEEDAERVRVFTGIPLGTPEAGAAVQALSADRFRAVLDTLATVTIAPVGKVGHVFHKDRVKVEWKS